MISPPLPLHSLPLKSVYFWTIIIFFCFSVGWELSITSRAFPISRTDCYCAFITALSNLLSSPKLCPTSVCLAGIEDYTVQFNFSLLICSIMSVLLSFIVSPIDLLLIWFSSLHSLYSLCDSWKSLRRKHWLGIPYPERSSWEIMTDETPFQAHHFSVVKLHWLKCMDTVGHPLNTLELCWAQQRIWPAGKPSGVSGWKKHIFWNLPGLQHLTSCTTQNIFERKFLSVFFQRYSLFS